MDKIREEFDGVNPLYNDGWETGYKSRDAELQKWRDINDRQEARIIDQDEEIKKLTIALEEIIQKYIDPCMPVDSMYRIAKEALEE